MELTKEQAIIEHRKMWNWIADQYERGFGDDIRNMKEEYIDKHTQKYVGIYHNCFCCEYASKNSSNDMNKCVNCPVVWETESKLVDDSAYCELFGSSYQKIKDETIIWYKTSINCKKAAELARKIANLPVRE